jgi:hypothetical protein
LLATLCLQFAEAIAERGKARDSFEKHGRNTGKTSFIMVKLRISVLLN